MTTSCEQIEGIRREWGGRLMILGHHYQSPAVLCHADVIGDSLELARKAAASQAERIVFCGVHFMAESADILTTPAQRVFMPEPAAGCPMAAMADEGQVEKAWSFLNQQGADWLPVVYVNSTARLKAFCGRAGGSACTSSNAAKVFQWALNQGKKIFFLPDIHLGLNSAHDLGIHDEETAIYEYQKPDGGLTLEALRNVRVLVWGGFCPIHVNFTVSDVQAVRDRLPEAKIIVHPEAPKEVVRMVDAHGSTSQIIKYVQSAPAGSTVVIGTESQLVKRLAEEYKDRLTIRMLRGSFCPNMAKTNEQNLLRVLSDWPDRHSIKVPVNLVSDARLCLERMLAL
ncbi:MAG: quinolinate synthase NadA [bacterium]